MPAMDTPVSTGAARAAAHRTSAPRATSSTIAAALDATTAVRDRGLASSRPRVPSRSSPATAEAPMASASAASVSAPYDE